MRSLGNWKITQMFQESYLDGPIEKMFIKVLKYFKRTFLVRIEMPRLPKEERVFIVEKYLEHKQNSGRRRTSHRKKKLEAC